MNIRFATLSDVWDMTELLCQLFSVETDFTVDAQKHSRGLTLLLNNGGSIVVAEDNNKVIGMIAIHKGISTAEGAYTAWIEDFIIDKKYRNKGLGTLMLEYVENWARENKIIRLQLLADIDNIEALEFYKHKNWKESNMKAWRKFLT